MCLPHVSFDLKRKSVLKLLDRTVYSFENVRGTELLDARFY
jgi:hypothetical protein